MSKSFISLFENGREQALAKGDMLFQSGDKINTMFLVLMGSVDLVRHARGGARMVIMTAAPMGILAEASAYSETYHCDAVASNTSLVKAISKSIFKQRLNGNAEISTQWAASLAHATQKARMLSEIRNLRTVADRLDAWLGSQQSLPPKGEWIKLADTLGVSKEALYRELAKRR